MKGAVRGHLARVPSSWRRVTLQATLQPRRAALTTSRQRAGAHDDDLDLDLVAPGAPLPRVARLRQLFGTADAQQTFLAGASVYLNFMSLTRSLGKDLNRTPSAFDIVAGKGTGTEDPEALRCAYLEAAAARYEVFMQMRADRHTAVPTRDISVMWATDMLRPSSYDLAREYEYWSAPEAGEYMYGAAGGE